MTQQHVTNTQRRRWVKQDEQEAAAVQKKETLTPPPDKRSENKKGFLFKKEPKGMNNLIYPSLPVFLKEEGVLPSGSYSFLKEAWLF